MNFEIIEAPAWQPTIPYNEENIDPDLDIKMPGWIEHEGIMQAMPIAFDTFTIIGRTYPGDS